MNETERQIDEYLRRVLEIEDDDPEYSIELNLFDAGFLDSVGAADLIGYVEDLFGIEITQKDITLYPMNSVAEIARVIDSKKGC